MACIRSAPESVDPAHRLPRRAFAVFDHSIPRRQFGRLGEDAPFCFGVLFQRRQIISILQITSTLRITSTLNERFASLDRTCSPPVAGLASRRAGQIKSLTALRPIYGGFCATMAAARRRGALVSNNNRTGGKQCHTLSNKRHDISSF